MPLMYFTLDMLKKRQQLSLILILQQVEIGDIVQFKTEVEQSTQQDKLQFFLKSELFFMEASEADIKTPKQIKFDQSEEVMRKFTCLTSRVYKIHGMLKNMHSYAPLAFDAQHFSCLGITLHSALMGNIKSLIVQTSNSADIHCLNSKKASIALQKQA